ncbi:MAG: hypothetical protein Q9M89_08615 [Persephonella sp.]|nr:hypothetical protein [Persephonella sp.]
MNLLILLLIFLFPFYASYGKVLYYEKYVGTFNGLEVYGFKLTIDSGELSINSKVKGIYFIKNKTKKYIHLGKYGAFFGCRNPSGKNKDFGHSFRNYRLKQGEVIKITGSIKLPEAGRWEIWPAFFLKEKGWSPYKWKVAKLYVKHVVIIHPPYGTCKKWKEAFSADAKVLCNYKTGFIGIINGAHIGAATSEAIIYMIYNSPVKKIAKVKAYIYYVGGANTVGYAAFAGLEAVRRIGRKYYRKDIEPWLNYEIAAEKIIDIALLAAPEEPVSKVGKALKILSDVKDYVDLGRAFYEAYQKGKAKLYVYSFKVKLKKGEKSNRYRD